MHNQLKAGITDSFRENDNSVGLSFLDEAGQKMVSKNPGKVEKN